MRFRAAVGLDETDWPTNTEEPTESIEFVPKRELDRAQQENEKLRKQSEQLQKENELLEKGSGAAAGGTGSGVACK